MKVVSSFPNLSLQQIQIFLKAVELENFSKAATQLNYTPSMVSKTITAMENELNIPLFIRTPRGPAPTPAAKYLAQEWRQLIGSVNHSISKARSYSQNPVTEIILGFVDSSSLTDQLVVEAIEDYRKNNPQLRILVEKHDMHRAAELLNLGMLDLIYTSGIESSFLDEHGLPWETVSPTDVCVYVPRNNPLFHRDCVTFADLRQAQLVSLDFRMHPSYVNWLYNICERNGFAPNIVSTFRTVRSLVFSLPLNDAAFIGESITSDWASEDLKMFTLPETSFTLLSWRESSQELLAFKDFLRPRLKEQFM